MRWIFVVMVVAALGGVPASAAGSDTYGAGVSLSETTPIARVIEHPADFEGKTVRVDGTVTAVCTMMGCWMALAPPDGAKGSTLMIKVDDGVIVFPVSAKGKRATAQGVIQRIGTDAESREAAAEHGEQARWQLKATGAVVH
jgi:hypothetical protein